MVSTYERRQQLARTLSESGQERLSVQELSDRLAVSVVTIRKDLAWLEEHNQVVRTHGGAMLVRSSQAELGFDVRSQLQYDEKARIGQLAASLVRDGDSIAIDASTTALALVRAIKSQRELTVVTNGLRAGMELAEQPGISVLMPGGMLRRESLSLVGSWGAPVLQRINIKTAFVGARGFTLHEGLTEVSSEEVAFKQALVEAARDIVALIDHTKWGQIAFATFCTSKRIKLVITDTQAPAEMLQQLQRNGIEVWTV